MQKKLLVVMFLLLTAAALTSPRPAGAQITSPATGRVHGILRDESGAVFSGLKVTLTGNGVTRETTCSVHGEYVIDVPPGTYRLTVDMGNEQDCFFTYRRAAFTVGAGQNLQINADLKSNGVPACVLYVGPPEEAPKFRPHPAMKFDIFKSVGPDGKTAEVLIEYWEKRRRSGGFEYTGVNVSSETYFLAGASARFNRKEMTVEVTKVHTLDTGVEQITADKATLILKDGIPELKRD